MLRLLMFDLNYAIIFSLVTFFIFYIVHISLKYPHFKFNAREEARFLISLAIFGLLYLVNSKIPLDNIGNRRYFIWLIIFLATIIFLSTPITKLKKEDKKEEQEKT